MVEAVPTAALPASIGRYTVLGLLATGGMAEIFLGKAPGGAPVVIKRVLPHLARQPAFVAMFVDEARLSSLLHHANIVEVHELGQVGFDLFMVMEYLEGESVAGLMRRSAHRSHHLPLALAAHVIAEACAGLSAAHELCDPDGKPLGLVHRDISPSNIFVTYAGDVKVLDFGIATAEHRLTQTATGQVKGKFSYMSPEQCRGESLDLRSDIFSLGVVLYELTTRRRLFKRANELMVLRAVTEEAIAPPRTLVRDFPRELDRVVMRALDRDPKNRHASARELRDELLSAIAPLGHEPMGLAAHMNELFVDRIAQKQRMLRDARHGMPLDAVPSAEIDETSNGQGQAAPTVAPPTRRRRWVIPVTAIVLAASGIAAWQLATRAPNVPSEPAIVAASPPAPAAPATFAVVLGSTPPGATLELDGARVGVTPYTLNLSTRRDVDIHLALDGYATVDQRLVLDHAQEVLVPLAALPTVPADAAVAAPVAPPRSVAHPKRQHPKPSDPFRRFDD
ncbi:MAG TPA: serine/threonine-protein kinase [Kofleriaceae bacterium]|jgi:serine/threonine-protein kinase